MRPDDRKAENVHQLAGLFAIGRQLRAEYSVDHPELMPNRLGSLVTELERDQERCVPAQVTPSMDSGHGEGRGAAVLRFPIKHRLDRRPSAPPSRKMGELWRFEMLLLDLLERNLQGAARDRAIRKLAAYFRICHAALESPEINDSDAKALMG
jgi:hypothetical protein